MNFRNSRLTILQCRINSSSIYATMPQKNLLISHRPALCIQIRFVVKARAIKSKFNMNSRCFLRKKSSLFQLLNTYTHFSSYSRLLPWTVFYEASKRSCIGYETLNYPTQDKMFRFKWSSVDCKREAPFICNLNPGINFTRFYEPSICNEYCTMTLVFQISWDFIY